VYVEFVAALATTKGFLLLASDEYFRFSSDFIVMTFQRKLCTLYTMAPTTVKEAFSTYH